MAEDQKIVERMEKLRSVLCGLEVARSNASGEIESIGKSLWGSNRDVEKVARDAFEMAGHMKDEIEGVLALLHDVALEQGCDWNSVQEKPVSSRKTRNAAKSVAKNVRASKKGGKSRSRKTRSVSYKRADEGHLCVSVTPKSGNSYEHWASPDAVGLVPEVVMGLDNPKGFSFKDLVNKLAGHQDPPMVNHVRLVIRFMRDKQLLGLHSRGCYKILENHRKEFVDDVRKAFEELPLWRDGAAYGG